MDNLNRENFWNEQYEKYPLAMVHFCNWIDTYKAANNWDTLFNAGILHEQIRVVETAIVGRITTTTAPKFHDLPLTMQIGIWITYVRETKKFWTSNTVDLYKFDLRQEITDFLECHEDDLQKAAKVTYEKP